MRSTEISSRPPRPIAAGGGRLAAFLAGSAAFGSLIIALLVALADLDDEPARPSSSRRPSRRG